MDGWTFVSLRAELLRISIRDLNVVKISSPFQKLVVVT